MEEIRFLLRVLIAFYNVAEKSINRNQINRYKVYKTSLSRKKHIKIVWGPRSLLYKLYENNKQIQESCFFCIHSIKPGEAIQKKIVGGIDKLIHWLEI